MANSDNVLRGGLTPKHVDVPELLATLVFEGRPPEVLKPTEAAPGELVYRTPAREFELSRLDVVPGRPFAPGPGRGVEVLLGLAGECRLLAAGQATPLGPGRSVLVPAAVESYAIEGGGRVCRARVPAC
jgi:mannose-6-phosphate isomerase